MNEFDNGCFKNNHGINQRLMPIIAGFQKSNWTGMLAVQNRTFRSSRPSGRRPVGRAIAGRKACGRVKQRSSVSCVPGESRLTKQMLRVHVKGVVHGSMAFIHGQQPHKMGKVNLIQMG